MNGQEIGWLGSGSLCCKPEKSNVSSNAPAVWALCSLIAQLWAHSLRLHWCCSGACSSKLPVQRLAAPEWPIFKQLPS
jgi:hypothetical protein